MITRRISSRRAFLLAPFFAGLVFTAVKTDPDRKVLLMDAEGEARRGVSTETLRVRREGYRRFMKEYGDPTLLCIGKILPADSGEVWKEWMEDEEPKKGPAPGTEAIATRSVTLTEFMSPKANVGDARDRLMYGSLLANDSGVWDGRDDGGDWFSRAADLGVRAAGAELKRYADTAPSGEGADNDAAPAMDAPDASEADPLEPEASAAAPGLEEESTEEMYGGVRDGNAWMGLDVEQIGFLRRQAEAGDASMQCLYGLALLNGSAGRTDRAECEKWLKLSADAGDEKGGLEFGKLLYLKEDDGSAQAESLAYLRPAAEKGSAEACLFLGTALLLGKGVEPDAPVGLAWLRKAANAGSVAAQASLGVTYFTGTAEVRQDYAEAAVWLRQAARQGHGDSANKMGVIFKNGLGTEQNLEKAVLWFTYGANAGDRFAQGNLAVCYLNGEWVRRDYEQAARWFEEAARRGHADSQYFLGLMYAKGVGVARDAGKAREWLALAARDDNTEAAELLESLYDDADAAKDADGADLRIAAEELLRESGRAEKPPLAPGRPIVLEIGDGVEISRADGDTAYYLTVPGCPGVIYCDVDAGDALRRGMVIQAVGGDDSGLPGFLMLEGCRVLRDESAREDE